MNRARSGTRDVGSGREGRRKVGERQPVPLPLALALGGGLLLTALGGGRCTPEQPVVDVDPVVAAQVPEERVGPTEADGPHQVVRVIDGDTIVVGIADGEQRTVRLLGIDSPESVHPTEPVQCFGPEASAAAAALVDGRDVWLEHDPSQDAIDRYGRALAYVWLDTDTMLNEVLVREGYAREYTFNAPGKYQERLTAAEARAQADGLGLWSDPDCDERE